METEGDRALRSVVALTRVSLLRYVRGWRIGLFALLLPVFFEIIAGSVMANQGNVPKPVAIAILGGPHSYEWKAALRAFPGFKSDVMSLVEARRSILLGRIAFAVDGDLNADVPELSVWTQPRWKNTAALLLQGVTSETEGVHIHLVEQPQYQNYFAFLCPGLYTLAIFQTCFIGVALALLNLRATGQLRHLMLAPVSPTVLIASEITVRFLIVAIMLLIMITVAQVYFNVAPIYDLPRFIGACAATAFISVVMGFEVGGIVPSAQLGQYVVSLLNFVILGLGQIFFQPDQDTVLGVISNCLPFPYLAAAIREATIGIPSSHSTLTSIGIPTLWLLAFSLFSLLRLRTTVDD